MYETTISLYRYSYLIDVLGFPLHFNDEEIRLTRYSFVEKENIWLIN